MTANGPYKGLSVSQRLMRRVDTNGPDGCWIWTGARQAFGYGQIRIDYKLFHTHRLSYEIFVGPVPDGLVLDHLCRNPPCCNPVHLEPVTMAENNRRGTGYSGRNAQKTHCVNGHAFTESNTQRSRGRRQCKTCQAARAARMRAAEPPPPRASCRKGHDLSSGGDRVYGRVRSCKECHRATVRRYQARKRAERAA